MVAKTKVSFTIIILFLLLLFKHTATAQVQAWNEERRGSVYFGVGNSLVSSYGSSTLHINQSSLGNDYEISSLKGSNTGKTTPSFSPLQLNYRLGYFFTYNQTWGLELNFDPATYYVKDNQSASMSGTRNGIKTNNAIVFAAANGYSYALNGADQILLNLVKRRGLFWDNTHKLRLDVLGKIGVGIVMPKANVTLDGNANSPKYQSAGWNAAAEIAFRATLFRYIYLEIAAKYDYASLKNIKIYDGTATQTLSTTSVTATIGFTLPTTKHHPLFEKGEKNHRIITLKPMYPSDAK